jgi:hypothetical protein
LIKALHTDFQVSFAGVGIFTTFIYQRSRNTKAAVSTAGARKEGTVPVNMTMVENSFQSYFGEKRI